MEREQVISSISDTGYIPANQECPFRKSCEIASGGSCRHTGVLHDVEFSCAAARGFVICENRSGTK